MVVQCSNGDVVVSSCMLNLDVARHTAMNTRVSLGSCMSSVCGVVLCVVGVGVPWGGHIGPLTMQALQFGATQSTYCYILVPLRALPP